MKRSFRPTHGKAARLLVYAALMLAIAAWEFLPRLGKSGNAFDVQTWNMEWFPAGYIDPQPEADESERISNTARIMRRQGVPDIFFAQEIRDTATCQSLVARLNDPVFKLAVCSSFYSYGEEEPSLQQVAIFTRFEIVDSDSEPWRAADFVYPPRGYAYALLRINDGLVACFNVHLKSNYIAEEQDERKQAALNRLKRELASQQLMRKVNELRKQGHNGEDIQAFIIAGDFNTSLTDARFESENTIRDILADGFKDAFEGLTGDAYATLPASAYHPAARFDFILYSGLQPSGKPFVFAKNAMSDHRSMRVTFMIPRIDGGN